MRWQRAGTLGEPFLEITPFDFPVNFTAESEPARFRNRLWTRFGLWLTGGSASQLEQVVLIQIQWAIILSGCEEC